MSESLKNKTIKGIIWSSVENLSTRGVKFLVMLIIARILTPKDYGLVGMLAIFISVSDTLVNSGFSQALIRKQNRTETDNCTVFYFNIGVGLALYIILFLIAPWIADFYEEPQLEELMRVLGIVVIIHSLAVVQRAILTQAINFRIQAKASFLAALISGVIGIFCAMKGFGVWALVIQQILNVLIYTTLLWYYSHWRPRLLYSWTSFKELFTFGSKLLASGLLDTLYNNMHGLVVGKVFSATSLGFYSRASQFADFPSKNATRVFQRVTYPVLCKIQDDDETLAANYRKLLRTSAFIIFPMMCLLAALAHPMIIMVLGQKWSYCAVLMVPICFTMMLYPIHAINLNLLQVKGRSDLFLKLEIIKKILGVTILCFSIHFGLLFMCYSGIVTSIICLVINTYYTGKLINVGFIRQMIDLSGSLITSLLMFALVYMLYLFIENNILILCVGLVIGIGFYIGVAYLFEFDEITYLKTIIRR